MSGVAFVAAGMVCGALFVADLVCRSLRMKLLLAGAGRPVGFRDTFVLTAFGDAAAVVTPLRAGGGPARLVGLGRAGVPLPVSVGILALDLVSYLAVVALVGVLLFWQAATGWLGMLDRTLSEAGVPLSALAAPVAVLAAAPWLSGRVRGAAVPWLRLPEAARGALGWPLALSLPLAGASIACRVAILAALTRIMLDSPALGAAVRASFVLVFGQLFAPTPSGAGAVELAFASGAAGELGGLGPAFVFWRVCTVVLPVAVGFGLALPVYGRDAVRHVLRARPGRRAGRAGGAEPPPPASRG